MIVNSQFKLYSHSSLYIVSDEKLSVKAGNSLPEFFQEEFPTFQQFIDAYYVYMSQRSPGCKRISTIADIDEIGRKYIQAFYGMYAKDMPEFEYIGLADFIRNSKAFYVSLGSEDSFRFLFKIMFGQDIEIKYPRENIFAGSIGKWNQTISIYVKVESGVMTDELIGRKLLIRSLDGSTSSLLVNSIKNIDTNIFEIGVDNFIKQNVIDGAKVFAFFDADTKQYKLSGEIKSGINSFKIINPGTGFLPGEVYSVNSTEGEITFRVTAVDINNGIKQIEFISFAGVSSTEFQSNIKSATIEFKLGTINTYTGFYENTDGFLSNQSKLEDNFFYQIFSYVIKSRVSRDLYIDLMEKILHPAGLVSFSEFEVGSEYQINLEANSDYQIALSLLDVINIYDTFKRKFEAFRSFSDELTIDDHFYWTLKKYFNSEISISDSGNLECKKAGHYVVKGYTMGELYTRDDLITATW